jgi:hypothetical protein
LFSDREMAFRSNILCYNAVHYALLICCCLLTFTHPNIPKLSNPITLYSCCFQCDHRDVLSTARAYTLMKDLSDSPALSLGPAELLEVAVKIGS